MIFLDKGKSCDEIREMFDWGEQTATLEEEVQSYFLFCICINKFVFVFELVPIQNEEVMFSFVEYLCSHLVHGNRVTLPKHAMLDIQNPNKGQNLF